jgi:hypothetical protein
VAFDIATAQPVATPKFDLNSAKPVGAGWNVVSHTPDPWAVVSHTPRGQVMANRDDLYTALRNADAAGDNEGAAKLAAYIKTLPANMPSSSASSQQGQPSDSPLKQVLMSPVGAAEELLKAGSRAVSAIPAGVAYGGAAIGKALGADVNPSDVQRKVSDALTYQPVSNSGQAADQAFADTYGPVGKAVADKADKVATAVGKVSPTAETYLREAPAAASAAGALVPAMDVARTAAGEISAAHAAAEANRPWQKAGLRTADDHPIARNVAGNSGREALTLQNLPVGNTIAANDAGVAAGQPLSEASLKAGRAAPNSVYDRVENALPTAGLDATAAADIKSAGSPKGGRITKGTPAAQQQIEALRSELLDPDRQFTGKQIVNELRGLRQEAAVNAASDDVSNQQLGNAQHDMADALEGHIGRNLPANGDVSLEQFQDARRALAKNFTVQGALRGKYVDPQALARVHSNNPGLLDGGLETYAQFAAEHPEVATLPSPSTRYSPPGLARDFSDIDLKKPVTYVQPLVGAAARRALTGSPSTALDQANAAFPPRAPGAFAPIPPPPPPKIAGLLPSPAMVNAGSGVTTPGALDSLGLTPDVQAAAAAHPGAPRLGALHRPPEARPPMEELGNPATEPNLGGAPPRLAAQAAALRGGPPPYEPPNWGLQANGAPPVARTPLGGGLPYADLLSEGVEQKPSAGLSLAPDQTPTPPQGIPFQRYAAHEAGDLALAPEDSWLHPETRAGLKDYADVLRQGVPEGILARTSPVGPYENNASGQTRASVEGIRAGTRPLELVNPDGVGQPILRDVEQRDIHPPNGHAIIDTSTGQIVERGPDLTEAAANGLRNRWAQQGRQAPEKPAPLTIETPEQTRQRLLARALRDSK